MSPKYLFNFGGRFRIFSVVSLILNTQICMASVQGPDWTERFKKTNKNNKRS